MNLALSDEARATRLLKNDGRLMRCFKGLTNRQAHRAWLRKTIEAASGPESTRLNGDKGNGACLCRTNLRKYRRHPDRNATVRR